MEWWEIRHYLNGLQRRYRQAWEQTRWSSFIHCKLLGSKITDMQELAEFPWEKTTIDPEEDAKQLQELIRACQAENERRASGCAGVPA